MKGDQSTSGTNATSSQQATAANAPARPESQQWEAETTPVDAQTRHETIAVAAHHLAAMRRPAAGCELDDRLRAEAEVLMTPYANTTVGLHCGQEAGWALAACAKGEQMLYQDISALSG